MHVHRHTHYSHTQTHTQTHTLTPHISAAQIHMHRYPHTKTYTQIWIPLQLCAHTNTNTHQPQKYTRGTPACEYVPPPCHRNTGSSVLGQRQCEAWACDGTEAVWGCRVSEGKRQQGHTGRIRKLQILLSRRAPPGFVPFKNELLNGLGIQVHFFTRHLFPVTALRQPWWPVLVRNRNTDVQSRVCWTTNPGRAGKAIGRSTPPPQCAFQIPLLPPAEA